MALISDAPNEYPVLDKGGRMLRVWYSWLQTLVDRFNGTAETLTSSGAISTSSSDVYLNGSSALISATLADGVTNQTLYVKAINITNAVTLTPSSFRDGTTITFSTLYDYIVLKFDGTYWNVFGGNAVVT